MKEVILEEGLRENERAKGERKIETVEKKSVVNG